MSRAEMSMDRYRKVIVLGLDGASPRVLEPMMDAGQAPAFARLRQCGTYRRLATTTPSQSPVAWSTAATGCSPGQHGVFDFLRRDPKTYAPALSILRVNPRNLARRRSAMFLPVRHGSPFWRVASDAGVPATVIRWPLTLPPEAVEGRMLAGLGVPDLRGSLGRYTFYTTGDGLPGADDPKGDVVLLAGDGGAFHTHILGPEGSRDAPMDIAVDRAARSATITVQGADHHVAERAWSERVRVEFPLRLRRPVTAQCRFYLKAAEPHLELYLSPLEADPSAPAFVLSHPDGYAAQLALAIGGYHTLGMPEDTHALCDGALDPEGFLSLCSTVMDERERMLWHELDRFERGCLACVFDTSDRVQHVFWDADAAHRHVIPAMYRRLDAILGRLLARLDDRTLLVVLSDHGFAPFRRAAHLNSWLVHAGYMALEGSATQSDALFRHVAWTDTRAYALGFSSLFLNRRRREGKGIVRDGDAAALAREIQRRLLEWRDPQDGARVLERVYLGEDIFHGPHRADAPDLVVGFRPGYRASWQTAIGGAPPGLIEDNTRRWRGDHLCDAAFVPGVLFLNRPVAAQAPHLMDIAPTVLHALGLAAPAEMEGKALCGV